MFCKLFYATVLSAALVIGAASETFAATQGTLGSTSNGTLTISVTKPPRANISNLSDMVQSQWSVGDGDVVLTNDVCVYSTRPSGSYTVKASGSGSGGTFTLSNGPHTMNYSVAWNAGGVGSLGDNGTTLSYNVTSSSFTKAATQSSTCNGNTPGPTARLIVQVTSADMTSSIAGTYTGTLTLLVTPN